MNRHELREKFVFVLYQHLLLKKDLQDCYINVFEDYSDDFLTSLLNNLLPNEEAYIDIISSHLKSWTFDRLNYVDQAILLSSVCEINLAINDKPIIIDEAIRLSKEYSDEDSYKYINGVLDNL